MISRSAAEKPKLKEMKTRLLLGFYYFMPLRDGLARATHVTDLGFLFPGPQVKWAWTIKPTSGKRVLFIYFYL